MISVASTYLEELPGETFLTRSLQSPIVFTLGKKIIKQGRLVLFKRAHFYIQITLLSSKNTKESFEVPIPFRVEEYVSENLAYFDYRIPALAGIDENINKKLNSIKIKNTNPSQYYNRILEIKARNV
jgi:hypothetical protein